MKDRKLTAPEMGRLTPDEYRSRPESGTVVVLDNVRSAYNVGSAFRSCDAFGVDKVYLCGICAVPPSNEIHKTALGAEESVPWQHCDSTLEAVASLKAAGYTVVSVEQTEHSLKLGSDESVIKRVAGFLASSDARPSPGLSVPKVVEDGKAAGDVTGAEPLSKWPRVAQASEGTSTPATASNPKYAFRFGNEVEGVQQSVVDASDFCLEIPQHGTKHSLNVAVTVGIVLFALTSPAR